MSEAANDLIVIDPLCQLFQDQFGLGEWTSVWIIHGAVIAVALLLGFGLYFLFRSHLLKLIHRLIHKTSNQWDDALAEAKLFTQILKLIPPFVIFLIFDKTFAEEGPMEVVTRLIMAWFIFAVARSLGALISSVQHIYMKGQRAQKAIRGYGQAAKIIVYAGSAIFMVATVLGKSPWGILSVLGGLTAVLLLVFKDTILGFVASVQLSGQDMVHIGDWISMPKHDADGDVIDVTVNTVKVRNWDKTITTIPTYALITDSFKNWRGMFESGGRRIKRSIFLDMTSVRFCSDDMLKRLNNVELLKTYITERQKEIDEANKEAGVDTSIPLNGRRQTNLGIFRAYMQRYLKHHPLISDEMTFLVRHLQPTSKGLPLEIYVFSTDQRWVHYEGVQADIMDHLLAALPYFGLKVFQEPTGSDFARALEPDDPSLPRNGENDVPSLR